LLVCHAFAADGFDNVVSIVQRQNDSVGISRPIQTTFAGFLGEKKHFQPPEEIMKRPLVGAMIVAHMFEKFQNTKKVNLS